MIRFDMVCLRIMNEKIMHHSKILYPAFAALVALMILLCQGCSSVEIPESHAISVDSEGRTGTGISVGSTYDDLAKAYGAYYVQKINGEEFEPYTFEASPEAGDGSVSEDMSMSHDGEYMVAAFYVDDNPASVEELSFETGIAPKDLADHLASNEYLAGHTVLYRYVIFTVKDNIVTDIRSDYLDYNGEL